MGAPLELGLNLSSVKPEILLEFAQSAEDMGFESVWIGEHIALANREGWWKDYPAVKAAGDKGTIKNVPFRLNTPFLEPLTALSHISGGTKKIRLGTGIFMLVLRQPILVGRSLAALDVLSKGRLDLAIGLGWSEEEYKFTGNDWKTRGPRTDEMIQCIKTLFSEEYPEFHGKFFDFPQIGFQPKPIQTPFPVHIGGFSQAAVRRAGKYGDGWYGPPEMIPAIKKELKRNGRENVPFKYSALAVTGAPPRSELEDMAEKGVSRCMVTPWAGKSRGQGDLEDLKHVEQYAKDVGLL